MLSLVSAEPTSPRAAVHAISRQTMSEGQPGFGCPSDIGAARGSVVAASAE